MELLQGSLQRLLVSLVQLFLTASGLHLQVCNAPFSCMLPEISRRTLRN